ncbi:MAG: cation-translocating P-type ATPase [Phototrophicaceae bacterium]
MATKTDPAAHDNAYDAGAVITRAADEIPQQYDVDVENGLTAQEVERRQQQHGLNRLREAKQRSLLEIFIDQFKSIVIVLLFVASMTAFAFGDTIEGVAILLVVAVNAGIGFFTELGAVRSMEALRELSRVEARVRRDGVLRRIDAEQVVPGDILVVEEGDVITSDARIIMASKLQVDESSLTGESVPVGKHSDPIDAETELADRQNMLYKGTTITGGSGEAVVVATGMLTELGHISELVEEAEDKSTPLEQQLNQLGGRLAWVIIVLAALVGGVGLAAGRELNVMVEIAIALAVAAIPEGLPIVATVALARGMRRMAQRNALVEQLETVETLGATNIILTDKTGTLTENEMQVTQLVFAQDSVTVDTEQRTFKRDDEPVDPQEDTLIREVLRIGVLCSNANLPDTDDPDDDSDVSGEPLEVALLYAGRAAGLERDEMLADMPEVREVAFDRETSMMATYHEADDGYYVAVKGAPDAIIDTCTHIRNADGDLRDFSADDRDHWREQNTKLAADGLRILAMAYKTTDSTDAEPYTDLIFAGLVGLLDPPRDAVPQAIAECQSAGIRVIMATGDQPETALNIAYKVGLVSQEDAPFIRGKDLDDADHAHIRDVAIFARITPEQKLDLITIYQEDGNRVAMTGDGVNDAPALRKADIGIAMGQRGTQAAREAADMVLQDDAFGTILVAVRQGRIIFSNIRKFIIFLLSSNIGQILIVAIAAVLNTPLPVRPLVILYLNIIIDVFPALALGVGEGREDVMSYPPRDSNEPVLARRHWVRVSLYSIVIATVVMTVYFYLLEVAQRPEIEVFTLSYMTLAFCRLWHVLNMRDDDAPIFVNEVTQNPWVWGAILLSGTLILISVYVPGINDVLGTTPPPLTDLLFVIAASLMTLVIIQIGKWLWFRYNQRTG